jgi:hypothetical protein
MDDAQALKTLRCDFALKSRSTVIAPAKCWMIADS